ncbi:MAG: CBS domain-containing protein [Bdellovibrionota bacterium]
MKMKKLLPTSPVCTVRADLTIGACIGLLRDKALGALVVVSDNSNEELVGIFTERDLVKNIELIRRGAFWDTPVRTVMTSAVHTISIDELHRAPELMAKHYIRHLPVVTVEKGKKRVVGVISMRDIFRIVMEEIDYDLGKILSPTPPNKKKKSVVGVFSSDPAFSKVVDEAAKITPRCLVKAAKFKNGVGGLNGYFDSFSALLIDIDGLNSAELVMLFSECRSKSKDQIYLAFSPSLLNEVTRQRLHKLDEAGNISLIAKPIALGLLYEKFLKNL